MPSYRDASQSASGTTASFNCNKPAATVSGDILICFHAADAGTLADMGTPTGGATWNLLASRIRDDGTGAGSKAWWKVAGGSEPSTYGFTQNSGADGSVSIIAVQDGATSTPVVAQSGSNSSTSSCTTPSTTPTGSDDFEIRCVALHAPGSPRTFTPPAGFTERTDIQSGNYALTTTATRTLVSGGASGVQTFTADTGVPEYHGFTVNIAASAATPITLTETGAVSDTLAADAATPLAETAAVVDALTVSASVDLADTVTAVDDLTVVATVTLADTGTVTDDVTGGVPIDLTDTVIAIDDLVGVPAPQLDEPVAGVDLLGVVASVPLTDTVTAVDNLTAIEIFPKSLTDTVSGTDALTVVVLEDVTVVAGAPHRGWSSTEPSRSWSASDPSPGWPSRPPTT
jgi:hypothetical protein